MQHLRADDGVQLAYVDRGAGPPLVFVHGWMMASGVWREQVEDFSMTHRVIAPDLRGCGKSEGRRGTYLMRRYANDLQRLLDHLDIRDATIIGWSMGGGITMEYLSNAGPERVKAVGLIDFPPRLQEDPSVADKVCAGLETRREAFLDSFLRRMVLDGQRGDLIELLRESALQCTPQTACEMYRAMRPTGPADPAPQTLPAFLAFPPRGWFRSALEQWKQVFPTHVAPEFPNSKHCPFLEEPMEFNHALHAFLEG